MIIILNFNPKTYITPANVAQIVAGIVSRSDPRYICAQPVARVIDVDLLDDPVATVDGIPLTVGQWWQFAIVPSIPAGTPNGVELLRLVNERRGYDWPVLVPVEHLPELEGVREGEFDLGMVVG